VKPHGFLPVAFFDLLFPQPFECGHSRRVVERMINGAVYVAPPQTKPEAHLIQGRVAFWKGVKIEE
ncbi:MAG: hypothetical protein ABL896_19555, partial [Hylemonella sp.]